jgi:hypothetical protein
MGTFSSSTSTSPANSHSTYCSTFTDHPQPNLNCDSVVKLGKERKGKEKKGKERKGKEKANLDEQGRVLAAVQLTKQPQKRLDMTNFYHTS